MTSWTLISLSSSVAADTASCDKHTKTSTSGCQYRYYSHWCVSVCYAYREFLIELVGKQWVGQLPEVEFTQGSHRMNVLNVSVLSEIRNMLGVKLMPAHEESYYNKDFELITQYLNIIITGYWRLTAVSEYLRISQISGKFHPPLHVSQ